ncbi:hypothetical protein H5410_027470 [Solanum commersonii]|uniref:Uncharacterized protein n=1 Tax=Solanum commersonii TaxID=4109 RepID=A0A9J5YZX8_SOLCO|nr:hypothetical protein H5410_027470 [Solanum commersonii]
MTYSNGDILAHFAIIDVDNEKGEKEIKKNILEMMTNSDKDEEEEKQPDALTKKCRLLQENLVKMKLDMEQNLRWTMSFEISTQIQERQTTSRSGIVLEIGGTTKQFGPLESGTPSRGTFSCELGLRNSLE